MYVDLFGVGWVLWVWVVMCSLFKYTIEILIQINY